MTLPPWCAFVPPRQPEQAQLWVDREAFLGRRRQLARLGHQRLELGPLLLGDRLSALKQRPACQYDRHRECKKNRSECDPPSELLRLAAGGDGGSEAQSGMALCQPAGSAALGLAQGQFAQAGLLSSPLSTHSFASTRRRV